MVEEDNKQSLQGLRHRVNLSDSIGTFLGGAQKFKHSSKLDSPLG
jgi:hypothetical protein